MKIQEVLNHFGDCKTAAEAIGLQQASFYQWRRMKFIPIVEQIEFEKVTKKKLQVDWEEYYKACKLKHRKKYREYNAYKKRHV